MFFEFLGNDPIHEQVKDSTKTIVLPRRINYLHYGDALEKLQVIREYSSLRQVRKKDLLRRINGSNQLCDFASYIVERYGHRRRKTIDVASAITDVERSIQTRSLFGALRCRGFSYDFSTRATSFPVALRSSINVRVAIFADSRMHYPPAVSKYLAHTRSCHFFDYYGPAIAFLLGILRGTSLYIVTLQSDSSCGTPSGIREHFRGWRRVLLNLAMTHFQPQKAYIVHSADVLRACHNGFDVPTKVPASWRHIYEQTAKESGHKSTTLKRGLNIQIYARQPKVITKQFYVLK